MIKNVFASDTPAAAEAREEVLKRKPVEKTLVFYFTARSGSSWLTSLLRKSALGSGREIFNPNFMPNMAAKFGARSLEEYVYLAQRHLQLNGISSFEITPNQLNAVFANSSEFFNMFSSAQSYWLIREDIVSQAVSLQKMVDVGVEHSTSQDFEKRQAAESNFSYDGESIKKWLTHLLLGEIAAEQMFQEFNITPFRLSYERNMALGEDRLAFLLRSRAGYKDIKLPNSNQDTIKHEKIGTQKNSEFSERFSEEYADFLSDVKEKRQEWLSKVEDLEQAVAELEKSEHSPDNQENIA